MQGDAVAVVVAESRALAKDAAELVEVDYEPLPAVTDVEKALKDGAPVVHDEFGTNRCYDWTLSAGDVDKAFAEAAVTVAERYRQNRLIPNAIEPRGVLVQPEPAQGEFTVWSATQIPHILRVLLAMTLGISEAKLRVIAPDVGGGFGSKLDVYAEEQLAVALARKLGRPVKWIEERSENYLATIHGRDVIQEIELAATTDGKITAVRANVTAAMGAYLQLVTPGIPLLGAWLYAGCYGVEAYDFACTGVFTNTTPTDAYRGAGRPEATYAIERAMDALARKLGKDPAELRRLNFITEFPATIASGLTIDSGDYHAALDRALEIAGYDKLRPSRRRAASAATSSSSASASRPTTRCAGSRRRGSSARSATPRAAGRRPRSAACRPAPSRCSPARRRTARGTRRRGRRSSPTGSASTSARSRCCTATRRSSRSGWTPTAAAASPSAGSRSTTRRTR